MGEFKSLGCILLRKAGYYLREVEVVGVSQGVQLEDQQIFLQLKVSGTQDEALLRAMSGQEDRILYVHVCEDGCPRNLTGETTLHGCEYKQVDQRAEAWYTNLEKVERRDPVEDDEMRRLREAAVSRLAEEREPEDAPKTKDKKEKKRKERDEEADKKEAKKKKDEGEDELEVGQKELTNLFGSTGLDPDPKKRRKVLSKARRLGQKKKKKKKKDSSSSSSGSGDEGEEETTGEELGPGLFDNDKRIKSIWVRCPGALTATMLAEAKESIVTSSGSVWEVDQTKLAPIMSQYVRQSLQGTMGGAMFQEAVTLATITDLLLRGHPARACDVASQRLKSLEGTSRGQHWTVSRQLELVRGEHPGIVEASENLEAARRAREEERIRALGQRPGAGRGGEANQYGKGGRKGGKDWRGTGRGRGDYAGGGKGGDGKKDDKQGWQKQEKK